MRSGEKNMDNKFDDQVLIVQVLREKLASEFTKIKLNTKKRNSESTNMKSDMKNTKTMLTQMIIQKHNS